MPTKLGQNFLKDASVVEKIIAAAKLQPKDVIFEVGPGEGVLTERLSQIADLVVAIEIDPVLAKKLQLKFKNSPNVKIVNADILKINLSNLAKSYKLTAKSYSVVANLPYYITSPIIRLFLEAEIKPKELILMVQKEVAERIVATPSEIPAFDRDAKRISRGKPGKMSILSLSVQYYGSPSLLFTVKNTSFDPIPKVDSAVIKIILNSDEMIPGKEAAKQFFRLIRAGFCAKRKTLTNNLSSSFHLNKKTVENTLQKIDLTPTVRAQELSLEDWKKLLAVL